MAPEASRSKASAQEMRPIQIWVPDVHAPANAAEARRQSLLVAQSPEEAEIQAFIDSVVEWPDAGFNPRSAWNCGGCSRRRLYRPRFGDGTPDGRQGHHRAQAAQPFVADVYGTGESKKL